MPAEKGDVRNLTRQPGVHERSPAWSPDGKIDRLLLRRGRRVPAATSAARTARASRERIKLHGRRLLRATRSGRRTSKKIAFIDNSQSLYWIDVESGDVEEDRVASRSTARSISPQPRAGRPTRSGSPTRWTTSALHHDRLRSTRSSRTSRSRSPTASATSAIRCSTRAASTCTSSPRPTPAR